MNLHVKKKLKAARGAFAAALTTLLCLTMTMPFGVTAFAAPSDDDSYAATLSSGMIQYLPDNGIYPNYLELYKFDPASDDFSYVLGDGITAVTNVPWEDGSGTLYSLGFKTTVPSEGSFTLKNPLSITQKNICQIGDRWVDLTVNITEIRVGAHQSTESWGTYSVGSGINLCGIYNLNADSSNAGAFVFRPDYSASFDYEWQIAVTYSDTGGSVAVPFEVIANDIDAGGPNAGSYSYFTEAWTFPDADYSRYDIYDDERMVLSYPSSGKTKFSADGNGDDYLAPKEQYAYGGVVAISKNGSFSGTTAEGGGVGTYLSFWCDYVAPFNDPAPDKSIDDPKSAYNAGDVVSFTCTMTMPEFMVETYSTYGSISLTDEIPAGLTYVDGSAGVYSGDTEVTDTAGTLTYTDNGDGTETVRFDFHDAWVFDSDNYQGQKLTLTLSCMVDEGYNGETLTNEFIPVVDDISFTAAADVHVTAPALSITKTADRQVYSLGDTVTYTILVNQTCPETVSVNTVVTDMLPEELELVNVTTDMGTVETNGNSFTAAIGNLWDTDTAAITVTAAAIATGGDIENIAYASADYVDEVYDNAAIDVRKPGLDIFKSADKEQYSPGETVTYTILVQNTKEPDEDASEDAKEDAADDAEGDAVEDAKENAADDAENETADEGGTEVPYEDRVPTAYNVVVTDVLPEGLTLAGVTDNVDGEIVIDGNSFTVSYPYMYYGDKHTITVEAAVDEDVGNTTLTNIATVNSDNTDESSDDAVITIKEQDVTPAPDEEEPDAAEPLPPDEEVMDITETSVPDQEDPPVTNITGPKTGQPFLAWIPAAIGGSAATIVVVLVRRRRKI